MQPNTDTSPNGYEMSKHPVGSLIAIQSGEGKVYMGIVSSSEDESCVVDVIADGVYRGAPPVSGSLT